MPDLVKRNLFTRDEIVLCIYAARYGAAEIGGIDSIHQLRRRSSSSIQMKICNIVAMCDDEGISRDPAQNALSGLTAGKRGRRTNWDVLSQYIKVPRAYHLLECQNIILQNQNIILQDKISTLLTAG